MCFASKLKKNNFWKSFETLFFLGPAKTGQDRPEPAKTGKDRQFSVTPVILAEITTPGITICRAVILAEITVPGITICRAVVLILLKTNNQFVTHSRTR